MRQLLMLILKIVGNILALVRCVLQTRIVVQNINRNSYYKNNADPYTTPEVGQFCFTDRLRAVVVGQRVCVSVRADFVSFFLFGVGVMLPSQFSRATMAVVLGRHGCRFNLH